MLTEEDIELCKKVCVTKGHKIDEKDIAFLILKRDLQNAVIAYKLAIGGSKTNAAIERYDQSPRIMCLREYMNAHWQSLLGTHAPIKSVESNVNITFEDNREAMIKMLRDTEELMRKGEIGKKDGMNIMKDIRIKLTDKFDLKETQVEQRIVVQPKFNYICEHTHKECWLMTEEWAKKQYHLIKDPDYSSSGSSKD